MNHIAPRLKVGLAAFLAGLVCLSTPASAFIACSKGGDCWHAETKVSFGGLQITYRPDTDLPKIKATKGFSWHEVDNLHNWLHGYWLFGQWYEAEPERN